MLSQLRRHARLSERDAVRCMARALGTASAAASRFELARTLHAPSSLAELGMKSDDIGHSAVLAVASPYPNPAPLKREGPHDLLAAAFHGREPANRLA